jgi:cytochrome c-type biogenesis protein CcmH
MIVGMVEGLAARLKTSPDDPDGWIAWCAPMRCWATPPSATPPWPKPQARYKDQPKVLAALRQAASTPPQKTAP